MIEVITNHSIEEMMTHPEEYVDTDNDIALVRVFGNDTNNPVYILVGQNESTHEFYLVYEDNEMSEDHYPENQTLYELCEELLDRAVKEE